MDKERLEQIALTMIHAADEAGYDSVEINEAFAYWSNRIEELSYNWCEDQAR